MRKKKILSEIENAYRKVEDDCMKGFIRPVECSVAQSALDYLCLRLGLPLVPKNVIVNSLPRIPNARTID